MTAELPELAEEIKTANTTGGKGNIKIKPGVVVAPGGAGPDVLSAGAKTFINDKI